MSTCLRDKFGPWLRHKVRVVIVKQWKKYDTIYKNLLTLKRIIKSNLDDTSIYQAAMTRLGWYRQCGLSVFNFLLSPKVLAMPKENRADKRKSRPGLVDPYALYQNLRTPICKPLHLLYLNELLRKFGGIENSSYICGKITYYERGYSC